MKNKKIRKIVNEAIGFIHLMSEGTVSEKEGKKVIKRLRKVKFCNLHFVINAERTVCQEHEWDYHRHWKQCKKCLYTESVDA